MKSTLFNVLVGICGSIGFAFLDKATKTFSDGYWWVALGLGFLICFSAAYKFGPWNSEKRNSNTLGSANQTDGDQSIEIGEVVAGGADEKTIGSGNNSKGTQKIKIDKVQM